MPLPVIAPYLVDDVVGLEANVTDWQLVPNRSAVLVHDMQRHFVQVFEAGPGTQIELAVVRTARIIACARRAGVPVIYTAQPPSQHPADRALLTDFWGPGLPDPRAAEIIAALAPHPGDTVLTKWRYSAFHRSDLQERLAARGLDQLVLTGVYAHIGCLATALAAFMHGVKTFFVADAMADFSREDHEMASRYVARRCGQVATTEQIVKELGGAPLVPPAPTVAGRDLAAPVSLR